jgi:hypothetical protein
MYSRKNCESFVKTVLAIGESTFVRLWMHAAGLVPRRVDNSEFDAHVLARPPLDALVVEWENMSAWDKQGVLFLMLPHIERIASKAAVAAAKRARELEPI